MHHQRIQPLPTPPLPRYPIAYSAPPPAAVQNLAPPNLCMTKKLWWDVNWNSRSMPLENLVLVCKGRYVSH